VDPTILEEHIAASIFRVKDGKNSIQVPKVCKKKLLQYKMVYPVLPAPKGCYIFQLSRY
jgi:hypothetical protein